MGSPSRVNDPIQAQKSLAFRVLFGIEYDRTIFAVVARTRITRLNGKGSAKLFLTGGDVERMNSLKITTAGLAHGHHVYSSVGSDLKVDHRC